MVSSRETVPLRQFGIEPVGDVPWGTHLCQFYETKQDLVDILVPYFAAGLRNNEFCMWVTSPPLGVAEARKALRKELPDLDEYVKKGQIEIISHKDWYLLGGKFDADKVLDGWVGKEKTALAVGFAGLRLTGNTFWIERSLWKDFADYEEAVNSVIGEHKIIALCTYSLVKCTGNDVIDIVRNHIGTLIKRSGRWVMVEDSWQRKQTEEEPRASEKRLRGTLDNMMDGCQIISPEWRYLYVNDAAAKHGRNRKEQLIGKTMMEMYPGIEKTDVFSQIERCIKGRIATVMETEFTFPDGEKGWFQVSIQPVPEGALILSEDITERKLAEQGIQQAKRDWERTFDSVPDLIAVLDNKHRIVRANKAMATRLGVPPEKCIGLDCYKCVHALNSPPDFCPHSKTLKDGKEHIAEVHEDRLGGDFLVSTSPLRDEKGRMVGSVHVARDITELKKIEQELRDSQKDLKRAQAVAKTGSWRLDVRLNQLLWSDETYKMFGIPLGTPLTYETFLSYVVPEDRAIVDRRWNAALKGEPYDVEHGITANGKIKWVREKAELEFDEHGVLLGGFGTVQDITERKQMESKLEEYARHLERLVEERTAKLKDAERMAAIGETAGMVGHDIRNPLQSIIGEVYLAKDAVSSMPEGHAKDSLKETIVAIEEQAEYINKIVTDLQDFAKPLMPCMEEVDLNSIVRSVSSTIAMPKNVEFVCSLKVGFPKFKADNAFVKRILINLFSNAIQAMPEGGTLTLRAKYEPNSVTINVEDTGVGIPEEFKPKIFQPLSTTKSKGQGFGLAVCRRLVEAMSGAITFESEEGKGTTFTFKIPVSKLP